MSFDKLCLVICTNFERETNAVLQMEDWKDVIIHTYPSTCCRPDLTLAVLEQMRQLSKEEGICVCLVEGCPTCAIYSRKTNTAPRQSETPALTLCFYRLAGHEMIDQYIREGSYLFTPGWLDDWDSHLKELGFDQTAAREFFGEFSSRLVLLDTGVCEHSAEALSAFSSYLDLPSQTVAVGLDFYRLMLRDIIRKWRMEYIREETQEVVRQANRKLADHALAIEFLSGLSRMLTEEEVIRQIMELFTMLFAPGRIVYASVVNHMVTGTCSSSLPQPEIAGCQAWLDKKREEYVWEEETQGFFLHVVNQEQTLGLLEFTAIAFPRNKQEYMNLTPPLANMCALAITYARLVQEVRQLANTDSLTGLSSRRHFFALAQAEFATARRYRRPLAAFMLDIDHFKKINDNYGHAAGDRTLEMVAKCCRRELRSADLSGRYGGEEFVFLLPETPLENAWPAAERLRQAIAAETVPLEDHTIQVTASIGLAMLTPDCPDIDTLINRCDHALYAAKEGGRNRVCGERPPSDDIPGNATSQCSIEQKH